MIEACSPRLRSAHGDWRKEFPDHLVTWIKWLSDLRSYGISSIVSEINSHPFSWCNITWKPQSVRLYKDCWKKWHIRLSISNLFGFCHSPVDIRASVRARVSGSERENQQENDKNPTFCHGWTGTRSCCFSTSFPSHWCFLLSKSHSHYSIRTCTFSYFMEI